MISLAVFLFPIILCAGVEISSSSGSVTEDRGTYYYELEKGSQDRDLTCGLEGVDQVLYQAEWTLPTKPNGEGPPEVEDEGNRIVFRTAYPAQNGEYICHICNANISVFVNVTQSTGNGSLSSSLKHCTTILPLSPTVWYR